MLKEGDRLVTGHRLVRFLGRGNFGEVWQATAPGHTYTALKFLNLEQSQGRKEYRAIQPLKHLRHANLLPMTAIWLLDENGEIIPDDDVMGSVPILVDSMRATLAAMPAYQDQHRPSTLIIAMPFADKNLDQLLKEFKQKGESGIPLNVLLPYMEDAARAIDFLNMAEHNLGYGPVAIRHCDIKPENLLLMGESVVLCDFGVSRTILGSSTTRKTAMGGSLAYMAPECIADEVSASSDQFSLAISYLELRTGGLPFESDSPAAVIEQRRKGTLDLSGLPKAEAAVIKRATSLKPERRYPSALEMVQALQQTRVRVRKSSHAVKIGMISFAVGAVVFSSIVGPMLRQREEIISPDNTPDQPKWEESETAAFKLIGQSELTETQFSEAIDQYGLAMEAGLPDERLIFPRPLDPVLNPKLKDEIAFEPTFSPFAFSRTRGIAGLQRNGDSLNLVSYHPTYTQPYEPEVIDSSLTFDMVGNFGWLNDQLLVFAQKGSAQFVDALPATNQARQRLFENGEDHRIDACFASSGKRAIVVDWDASRLVLLERPLVELKLPMLDPDDNPLIQLSSDGNWAAVLASEAVYVTNLAEKHATFVRLELGSKQSPEVRTFSFEHNDSHGWLTVQANAPEAVGATLRLMKFTLTEPTKSETFEIASGKSRATSATIYASQASVGLNVGFANGECHYYPNLSDRSLRIESTNQLDESYDNEVLAMSVGSVLHDDQQWGASATRDGSIFIQKLTDAAPTMILAQSAQGIPKKLVITRDELIVGFEKGAVEVYDFTRCRMIYESAAQKKRFVQPSRTIGTVKS